VATVPSLGVRQRDLTVGARNPRLWQLALAGGLLLSAVFAVVPESHTVLRGLVIYPLVELGSILAIVVGVHRYRPTAARGWLLIAGGLACWMAGDIIWGAYTVLDRDPFPSVADPFYLLGYPFLALGLGLLARAHAPPGEDGITLDAAIVTVAFSLIAWIFLVETYQANADLSLFESVVSLAYPVGDVLLLAVSARLLFSHDVWRLPSVRLLAAALVLTLVADGVFALGVLERVRAGQVYVDTGLLAGIVLFGVAALHYSMPALTRRVGRRTQVLASRRLAAIVVVCVIPTGIVVAQALRGELVYVPACISGIVLLGGLAFARFVTLTAHARRAANRESILSKYAAELLQSNGREALFDVAKRAANELTEGKAQLVDPPARGHAFSAPVTVQRDVVAELVADAKPSALDPVRDSLRTVAAQLTLALDRERLLAGERAAAEALADQNERLRELDRMKDQFVSMVSHELRTPLTSMVGYVELLLEGSAGEVNEEQRHFLEIVNRSSERLNRLIDDILFVARIDAGKFALERADVDLVELSDAAVEASRPVAESEGVELRLSAAPHAIPLWADPTRVSQLLDNLVSNAIKFTPSGGSVSLTVDQDGETARIQVGDTGLGIPEDELEHLFGRFFRASTAIGVRGTGLGLSIVKSIAEAHGGTVSVESEVGVGTTFTVDLPMQSRPDEVAEHTREEVAT
jgi:signal transduction histidine kinase